MGPSREATSYWGGAHSREQEPPIVVVVDGTVLRFASPMSAADARAYVTRKSGRQQMSAATATCDAM
jgi:hypothetical protein